MLNLQAPRNKNRKRPLEVLGKCHLPRNQVPLSTCMT
uniref:Uncharacterized protein n=1 Tax=Arundo donax TaxID=35708 RepID=A0A0A9EBL6_ARUDO